MVAAAQRWWWLLAPLVVVFAYRTIARAELVGDAAFLIADNRYLTSLDYFWGNLTHDYFWSSAGTMVPYWRPVTKLSWLLEHQLWGGAPLGYAVVQLGWHLAGVVGVELLAVALGLRRMLAIAAGLVFGLHPVSVAPVCMLMARSDVVCVAASIWAVLGWWRARDEGATRRRWLLVHLVAVVLAVGSKETAVVLPAILGVFAILLGDARPNARARLWLLVPSLSVVLIYLPIRARLLAAEAPGLAAMSVDLDPLRVGSSLAMYLTSLAPWTLESAVRNLPVAEAKSSGFWLAHAVGLVGAVALGGVGLWRRSRTLLGALLWLLAALAPVLLVAQISVPAIESKFPLDDRWLYHALAPAVLGWAEAVRLVGRPRIEQLAAAATGLWCAAMLWRAPAVHAELSTFEGMLDNEDRAFYHATPEPFRTPEDHCRFHERRMERAVRRRDDSSLLAAFGDMREQCQEIARPRWSQAMLAVERQRRVDLAEAWLPAARAAGSRPCAVELLVAEAARQRAEHKKAAPLLESVFACGGRRDASLLLAAATEWLEAAEPDRARPLVELARRGFELAADQQAQADYLERRIAGEAVAGGEPVLRGR